MQCNELSENARQIIIFQGANLKANIEVKRN